ncbi:dipeptide ABC transporter ATP-binding protein [Dactylosporangium sp. CA-233914]|uniref:dipeptide ABC transporter ATP-binding protein n=1 Tax=Dactylosporangium sp. CA-233914 TaxID=3239934 RepID=UPI003D94F9BE
MTDTITPSEPANQPAALEIEGLTLGYRSRGRLRLALEDVSLRIGAGEKVGLVGESGSGKTTVAMATLRYLPRNAEILSGSVRVGGRDVLAADKRELRELRGRHLAAVYQDPGSALNPTMTIGRQVAEVFWQHMGKTRGEAQREAIQALERVEIPSPAELAHRYPHQLSGGQQQRVMIAMALASDPALLILDEPTTGLDATVEASVLELIDDLCSRQGTALLLVSHNLSVVKHMCDSVAVMYAGRIVEQGPAATVLATPAHRYAAGLLRAVPSLAHRKLVRPVESIAGAAPAPGGAGCAFRDSCDAALPECATATIALRPVGPGHLARCVAPLPATSADDQFDEITITDTIDSEPLLQVRSVHKSYRSPVGDVQAVSDVSFTIHRGEVFAIVGESGSGKSTLAKCLAGLETVDSGELILDGTVLPRSHKKRRRLRRLAGKRITLVFQNPATSLNPTKTVSAVLRRALKMAGADPDGSAALAEKVRLRPQHLPLKTRMLSGGLQQRLAIGRASAGSPPLIVCDEPVSALDVSVQAAILNLLAEQQRDAGAAYLFISHDLSVVRYLADTIAVMYLGEILEIGHTAAVFDGPHHPYTAALLSAATSIGAPVRNQRIRLAGSTPSMANKPTGCVFHTRCPVALPDGRCSSTVPPWQGTPSGKQYKCHLSPEQLTDTAPFATPGDTAGVAADSLSLNVNGVTP